MDKYKKAERRLINLNMDKAYLQAQENKLKLLEEEYNISGVSFDGVGSSGEISDTTGNTALNIFEQRVEVERVIKRVGHRIDHLEDVLENLTDKERTILVMFYVEHQPMWKIRKTICYEKTQTNKIKSEAMAKLVRGLYGE